MHGPTQGGLHEVDHRLSNWEALEIDAPVEWVKTLRRQDESRLDAYWNNPQ